MNAFWHSAGFPDIVLYTFRTAGALVLGNTDSIHIPHRNQRYECAFGIQWVLICDLPKPRRGERCIVSIDRSHH